MRSIFALGMLAIAGLSAAQDSYPYTIDPSSVSESDRQTWCSNQKAQCPLICLQQPGVTSMTTVANDCDPDTLSYSCVCANNVAPNITQYSQTIPYYVCTEWGNQCVNNCTDNTCKNACRADHPCGAQDPPHPNTTASTTLPATSTQAGSSKIPVTGFGGSTSTATAAPGKGAASAMLHLGESYSMAIVFAGVFAGFAVLL